MIDKKKIPLILALAIPVIMILLVAAFIYLPGLGQKPKVNFVYMTGSSVYYYDYNQPEYTVSGEHLVHNPPPPPLPNTPPNYYKPDTSVVHFYLYNVSSNTASELTFEQAQGYRLDSSNTSADNYTIARGNGGGGDFFFGGVPGDYNSWYIKGHNHSTKLNLKLTGNNSYYQDNFRFLGWVEDNHAF